MDNENKSYHGVYNVLYNMLETELSFILPHTNTLQFLPTLQTLYGQQTP